MKDRSYWKMGLMLFLTTAAVLVFYNTVFQNGVLLLFLKKLFSALTPVLIGCAMAYLLAPIEAFFENVFKRFFKKLSLGWCRTFSLLVTWVLVGALVYVLFLFLLPNLIDSISQLINNLSSYYNTLSSWLSKQIDRYPNEVRAIQNTLNLSYGDLSKWLTTSVLPHAQTAFSYVTGGVVSVVTFCTNLLVGIAVSVYLLAGREKFLHGAKKLFCAALPHKHYRRIHHEVKKIDRIFSGFVRGKVLDSLIIGILCFFFCSLFRFPYAPLVSVLVGVTNVIPFFGPFLGAIPSALLILLVDPLQCLYFIILIVALQQFDGNVLGPRILSESLGISGFWVIVAILLGGSFFGVLGMFLGVPVFACIYSSIRYQCSEKLHKAETTPPELLQPPVEIFGKKAKKKSKKAKPNK